MKNLSILLIYCSLCYSIMNAQTVDNFNYFELIEAPKIPLVSQIKVDYTNVYETPTGKVETFIYEWSNDNQYVKFKDLWNTNEAELDANKNVTFYKSVSKMYPYSIVNQDYYKYDSLNRVIEKEIPNSSIIKAYYTETPTDSVITWNYDKTLATWYKTEKIEVSYYDNYFDKLYYSYNNENQSYNYRYTTRYYLDNDDRIIQFKDLDSSAGSIYDFTYTDNGYIKYITYYGANHASFKYEYTFNEQGDIATEKYYEWMNNSYWKPCITTKNEYIYLGAGINKIENEEEYSLNGNCLTINTDNTVSVYSIDGRIIYSGAKYGKIVNLPYNQIVILKIAERCYKIAVGQ